MTVRHFLRIAGISCFGIIAWLSMMLIPMSPVSPDLDLSWAGALSYFAHRGFDFGTEVVFTYGPLGHLATYAYSEYFATARLVWEVFIKAMTAALCCWALCELRGIIRILFALCVILFLGNFEETYSLAIVLATCLLLRNGTNKPWFYVPVGILLAALALIKFTYFLQSSCAMLLLTGSCVAQRRWTASSSLVLSFAGGILLWWQLAGQAIAHLPQYIRHSVAIAVGYNSAMLMPTASVIAISLALVSAVLLVVQLVLFQVQNQKTWSLLGSIFVMLILFLLWKHAFTRWENHAPRFFLFFPVLLLSSWLLNRDSRLFNPIPLAVATVAIISALIGATVTQPGAVSEALPRAKAQVLFAYRALTNYQQLDLARQRLLQEARGKNHLPKIQAIVGTQPVDVFGYRQGIALLNELNYIPRPVFQGYSAYTPSLIALNTEHYQSNKRPRFVISKLETIDNRFPTLDDSKVLLELLYHYQPIVNENGWQLWEAADLSQRVEPRLLSTFNAKLGQHVAVPASHPIWLELELKQTRWGRLRSLFYKSAPVVIELEDDAEKISRYRIIPSMTTSGFLLNPEIATDDQVVNAALGGMLPRYKWFKVTADSGETLFKNSVRISFSALPELGAFQ